MAELYESLQELVAVFVQAEDPTLPFGRCAPQGSSGPRFATCLAQRSGWESLVEAWRWSAIRAHPVRLLLRSYSAGAGGSSDASSVATDGEVIFIPAPAPLYFISDSPYIHAKQAGRGGLHHLFFFRSPAGPP